GVPAAGVSLLWLQRSSPAWLLPRRGGGRPVSRHDVRRVRRLHQDARHIASAHAAATARRRRRDTAPRPRCRRTRPRELKTNAGATILELRTKRLRLRPCVAGDLDTLWSQWTTSEVRHFLWDGRVISR